MKQQSKTATRIGINGCGGRMGLRLVDLVNRDPDLQLISAVESAEHELIGHDAGVIAGVGEIGVVIDPEPTEQLDCMIDFSSPIGFSGALEFCTETRTRLVAATTGLSDEQVQKLKESAHLFPIVFAPNMSLAVNLSMKLAESAATILASQPIDVDVEIIERHHRFKRDAPSGTALKFGQLISAAMDKDEHVHGRFGDVGERKPAEIGYHAVRTGDDPGQHTIIFGMLGETIELRVAASNRDCYALGAIAATKFLIDQGPGLYDMFDVLGI